MNPILPAGIPKGYRLLGVTTAAREHAERLKAEGVDIRWAWGGTSWGRMHLPYAPAEVVRRFDASILAARGSAAGARSSPGHRRSGRRSSPTRRR